MLNHQVRRKDPPIVGQDRRPLDHNLQFPDITRPGMISQRRNGLHVEHFGRGAMLPRQLLEKMTGKQFHIAHPGPEWRQIDMESAQSIK